MKYILCFNDEMKQCQSCFIFNEDIIVVLLGEKCHLHLENIVCNYFSIANKFLWLQNLVANDIFPLNVCSQHNIKSMLNRKVFITKFPLLKICHFICDIMITLNTFRHLHFKKKYIKNL
jgi:hypothetical protein